MLIILLMIQIIAESLPISSSTHVLLAQALLAQVGYDVCVPRPLLWLVHGITALLMLALTYTTWLLLARHPWRCRKIILKLCGYGLCAELITVLFYSTLHIVGVEKIPVVFGLMITTLVLCSLRFIPPGFVCLRRITQEVPNYAGLTSPLFYNWLVLGLVQGVAVIPGCSRLALTYAAARWLGCSGFRAWLMSCTLAMPLFGAASLVGAVEVMRAPCLWSFFSSTNLVLLLLATSIAGCALYLVRTAMIKNQLYHFAWYMGLLTLVSILLGLLKS